jgi:hypothetical protein
MSPLLAQSGHGRFAVPSLITNVPVSLAGLVEWPGTAYHVFMPKLVKRYARTRLYDTEALRYVTVADLMLWVSKGISFIVIDAETGEDITRILLV